MKWQSGLGLASVVGVGSGIELDIWLLGTCDVNRNGSRVKFWSYDNGDDDNYNDDNVFFTVLGTIRLGCVVIRYALI